MPEVFDVGQIPDDPMHMPPPYWRSSGAVFQVVSSLQKLLALLNQLVPLNRKTDERLKAYFEEKPDPPEEDLEFSDICDDLWQCEHEIGLVVETAILTAAIASEDHLNMCAVFNLHRDVSEPLEKLSPTEKLQVISALLDKPGITGKALFGELKLLSQWRNAYAHGHCVDRTTKTLRHNHLVTPAELPGIPSEIKDVINMVGCCVRIYDHVALISKNPYTRGKSLEIEEIRSLLREIARFRFSGSDSVYEVTVE